jgi:hypothetical protein
LLGLQGVLLTEMSRQKPDTESVSHVQETGERESACHALWGVWPVMPQAGRRCVFSTPGRPHTQNATGTPPVIFLETPPVIFLSPVLPQEKLG